MSFYSIAYFCLSLIKLVINFIRKTQKMLINKIQYLLVIIQENTNCINGFLQSPSGSFMKASKEQGSIAIKLMKLDCAKNKFRGNK